MGRPQLRGQGKRGGASAPATDWGRPGLRRRQQYTRGGAWSTAPAVAGEELVSRGVGGGQRCCAIVAATEGDDLGSDGDWR